MKNVRSPKFSVGDIVVSIDEYWRPGAVFRIKDLKVYDEKRYNYNLECIRRLDPSKRPFDPFWFIGFLVDEACIPLRLVEKIEW